ncbi:Flagellar hook-associated protein 1 [Pseudomonas knackmussii B13]|uniref:Flagellar hook-associated protein 1 n=1 Tax=Pseudomonas knackmussii (strain DSM 6978 / CCUG 54928 / LMG 23759 / B13) TaxID=1301098 RepID=A0A024HGX8_PSEKB|nr:flagellar hook-associated protein FlgK [Pseudomonas knackmussii]CDF83904.1 Flagellar hook-associated protein 1 [Pseudomonas knackmussii B13]
MSNLTQIAYSGVRASEIALSVTGQNTSNVNTPGFSRLSTVMSSLGGQGMSNPGGGVTVSSIRRMSDDFHNQQLWRATTAQNYYSDSQQYLGALEDLMSSDGASINVGLDNFFTALSEATGTPDSDALRKQIITEAGNLAQRFNTLSGNIDTQLKSLQEQRSSMVGEINGLTSNIALLNKKIVAAKSAAADPSALQDQRDALITQLSQYSGIRTATADDGSISVSLANGQPLVAGASAAQLKVSLTSTGEQDVSLSFAGTQFSIDQQGLGGGMGALYDTEYQTLRPNQDRLGQMASQVADLVNNTLAGGFDLDGNAGQPLLQYNAGSTKMLTLTGLTARQLALSDSVGEAGNNGNLLKLIDLKNQSITLDGNAVSLNDAYAGMIGEVASASRQNQGDLDTAKSVTTQAQAQRDSVSAVNLDEEAVNLMTYQQAYQANMKVISTAKDLFDSMLAAF